jgi:hypothetical protein
MRNESILKGILPASHSFHGGERLILFSMGLMFREKAHVSL